MDEYSQKLLDNWNEIQNDPIKLLQTLREEVRELNDEVNSKVKLARIYCYLNNIPFGFTEAKLGNQLIKQAGKASCDSDWDNQWLYSIME